MAHEQKGTAMEAGLRPVFERGQRHERALALSLAEMYAQGIATRRVTEVPETMCGRPVSPEQVPRASALLGDDLEKWRNRPLGCGPATWPRT